MLRDDSLSMAQADASDGQTHHTVALAHLKNDLQPSWKGARQPRVGHVAERYRDGPPAEKAAQIGEVFERIHARVLPLIGLLAIEWLLRRSAPSSLPTT